MPPRNSPLSTPHSSLDDGPEAEAMKLKLRQKIREGQKRRQTESQLQREEARARQEEEEARRALERGDVSSYIPVILVSLLFAALPLSERVIDWVQVLLVVGLNVVYAVVFHRQTWIHYMVFVMLNLLLVQWGPFVYQLPEFLAALPAIYYFVFVLYNALAIALPYALAIRGEQSVRRRDELWDYTWTAVLLLNFAALIASGIVPAQVLFRALRSLLNLATHYSIEP